MKARHAVALMLLAGLAFHLPAWVDRWRPTWDSAVYLTLARNLADGAGYTWEGAPHLKYPPGLALMLAPLAGPPGSSVLAERGVMIACALAWMLLLYFGLRGRWGPWVALGVALCAGLNYALLIHTIAILSDVPFLAAWTLSLLLGERLRRDPSARNALWWLLSFLLAFSIRIVALVQLPVFALLLWRRFRAERGRRRALALVFAVAVLVPAAWFARTELLRPALPEDLRDMRSYEHEMATGESYQAGAERIGIGRHLAIAWGNLDYYRGLCGEALSAYVFPARTRFELAGTRDQLGWWFALAVMLAAGIQALRLYRRGEPWLVLSSLLYLLLVLAWPSRQGVRFLLPLYPLLFLALVSAASGIRRPRLAAAALPAAALLFHAVPLGEALAAGRPYEERGDWGRLYAREHREPYLGATEQLFIAAGEHVAQELPRARIACDDAAYLVFLCGIHARSFPVLARDLPAPERGRRLAQRLRELGITHVLLVPQGRFAWPDLIAPLVAAVGVERLGARCPATMEAIQALARDPRKPPPAAPFVVPLRVFD